MKARNRKFLQEKFVTVGYRSSIWVMYHFLCRLLYHKWARRNTLIPSGLYIDGTQKMSKNYTYMVECSDHTYYTGWTNDLEKRIRAHNAGRGARYTKPRRPVRLVYFEMFDTKEEAMRREWEIKQMSRSAKERLLDKG